MSKYSASTSFRSILDRFKPSESTSMPGPIVTPTAITHMHYNPRRPPARPSGNWVRFICVSDTHCATFDVPDGDVFIHAGDLTHTGRYTHFKPTIDWIKKLPHRHKIVIGGNHDLTLDTDWYLQNGEAWHRGGLEDVNSIRHLFNPSEEGSFTYLEYESCEIEAGGKMWKIYGSPGSPEFGGWAFNYERVDEAVVIASRIPNDADIVITHGPPLHILDQNNSGVHCGCPASARKIEQVRPLLHVFGHIHESHGAAVREWRNGDIMEVEGEQDGGRTVYVNAALEPRPRPLGEFQLYDANEKGRNHMLPIIVDLKVPELTTQT